MQPGEKKKLALLIAMLAVLAAIWGYRLLFGQGQKAVTPTGGNGRRPAAAPPKKPVTVELELLERDTPGLKVGRNIFNPAYKVPVVEPPKPENAGKTTAGLRIPAQPPQPPKDTDGDGVPDNRDKCPDTPAGAAVNSDGCQPEVIAGRQAAAEMKNIKFIGFLKRSKRMDVFMSMAGNYYVAAKGEDITKSFYLKDIGENSIVVADRVTGAEVSIQASFQESDKSGEAQPAPGYSGGGGSPTPGTPSVSGRPAPPARGRQLERPGASAGFPAVQQDDDGEEEGNSDDDIWDEEEDTGAPAAPAQGGTAVSPGTLQNRSTW